MLRLAFVLCLAAAVSLVESKASGSPLSPRVLGGQDAAIEDFPFAASISQWLNGHQCGATVISAEWVLTDGWCTIEPVDVTEYTVAVGTDTLDVGGSRHHVVDWVFHPLMDVSIGDFDFALVRVSPPFDLNSTLGVAAAALPSQDAATPADADASVAGWGQATVDGDWTVARLQFANLTTLDDDACAASLGVDYTRRHLCARNDQGAAVCFRDEGAPLVSNGELLGVALYPGVCADGQPLQMFSRVAAIRDWISEITGF